MKKLLFLFFFFLSSIANAQHVARLGSLPAFSFQWPVNDLVGQNIGLSSQMLFFRVPETEQESAYRLINVNFTYSVGYKYSPGLHLGAGLLFRLVDPARDLAYEIRPSQQVTFIKNTRKFRIRNRFTLEERFFTNRMNEFDLRMRYSLGADFPLTGQQLDPGENYLNFSSEILSTPTSEKYSNSFNYRPYAAFGRKFNQYQKLEVGVELRTQVMVEDVPDIWFLRITWFYSS